MRFTLDLSNRRTFLVALMLFMLAITIFVIASPGDTPNPGHDATQVRGGSFRNATYIFPKNVSIKGNLTVGTNSTHIYTLAAGQTAVIIGCTNPATQASTKEFAVCKGSVSHFDVVRDTGVITINGDSATTTDPSFTNVRDAGSATSGTYRHIYKKLTTTGVQAATLTGRDFYTITNSVGESIIGSFTFGLTTGNVRTLNL